MGVSLQAENTVQWPRSGWQKWNVRVARQRSGDRRMVLSSELGMMSNATNRKTWREEYTVLSRP